MTMITSLPNEITSQVLFYLPLEQLPLLRRVCKLWNQVLDSSIFITTVCEPYFGSRPKNLNKEVLKKIYLSHQWLSRKLPCNPQINKLPLDEVGYFAKCKEGIVIAGESGLYFKSSQAKEWNDKYGTSQFITTDLDVHQKGYVASHYERKQLCHSTVYFQKWENDFAENLFDKNEKRITTSVKVYKDDLFVGTCVLFANNEAIEQWDLNQFRPSATFVSDKISRCVSCLSCNGTYLAGGGLSISLWDLRKPDSVVANFGSELLTFVRKLDLQGTYLLESRDSFVVNFWDLRCLKSPVKTWGNRLFYSNVQIEPPALLIAKADTGIVEFWSISDLEKKQEWDFSGHEEQIFVPGISWEGNHLDVVSNRRFNSAQKCATIESCTI